MEINLLPVLKMLGVKVEPEHVQAVERIIPQIPGRLEQAVSIINTVIQNNEKRMGELLEGMEKLSLRIEKLEDKISDLAGLRE